ncbi:MAG: cell division protein FtsQ/DivIB, partial [Oscillospiraceae bacterium]|nr:cell division protein FtsQ/DivIB [Oscillospiraceae bacterium]
LEINVTKCVAAANIKFGNEYILVSQKGKILDKVDSPQDDLIIVNGFDSAAETLGTYLTSNDEQKTEIYFEIFDYIANNQENKIKSIDMTDKYDIIINYDDRINFELGNANDITYKLKLAETVFGDLGDDKKGTMEMVGSNQISFRNNTGSDKKTSSGNGMIKIPIEDNTVPESTSEFSDEDYESSYEDSYSDDDYVYDDEYDNYEEDYVE